jgi:hypothetical protein
MTGMTDAQPSVGIARATTGEGHLLEKNFAKSCGKHERNK